MEYKVRPLTFRDDGYCGVGKNSLLNPNVRIRHIGYNIRKLEDLEDGTLKARQLIRGIEVLGGMDSEIEREFIAPIEERNEF